MQLQTLLALPIALLISSASSCIQYQGQESESTLDGATIYDDGQQLCSFTGAVSNDDLYHFGCVKAGYTAVQHLETGYIEYNTPAGSFSWQATNGSPVDGEFDWLASEFGCC